MQIHRVVARIGIAVGPDACLGHLKPVGLDKPPKLGVVVAGVEVLETLIIVIAFADEPLGLDRDGGINVEVRDLAKRPVGGPFDQRPGGGELLSNLVFETCRSCGDLVWVCGFDSVFERDACDDFSEVVKAA